MQTVLQWTKKRVPVAEERVLEFSFSYYLQRFFEWKQLKENPEKNADRLKHFETLHGKGFVESLCFFEKMLSEEE